ncbi:demethoxyubiquinone hydroxylase family protein [Algimonas porphyrae]
MLRPARTPSEKMIKVDHAGENGAVNIYRAQRVGAAFHALFGRENLRSHLAHFQEHEEEHRAIFAQYLKEAGVRRCVSYHLCGLGGWTLGLITGLMGSRDIHATTYAVESVVLEHLRHQLDHLGTADAKARKCVAAIYEDELSHHDSGQAGMGDSRLEKLLVAIVKACTSGVIAFGMR